jgi:acetyl-CoA C-acetyltransferase
VTTRRPVPVVVGVGQVVHRDDDLPGPAEPLELIVAAARAAEVDSGGGALARVDALELMSVGSWPYHDLPGLVATRLGLETGAARRRVHPTGGETPVRALDAAAARIAAGETRMVLIAGAEGTRAATRARRAGADPPWTPAAPRAAMPWPGSRLERAFAVGICRALNCFPLYEHGLRAHERRTLSDAQEESAGMWSSLARVAAENPYAWSRAGVEGDACAEVRADNRMVSFPYPKLLTANPFVNQGAALLVTDTHTARSLGVPEDRWVYPLGGAGADEPVDPRARVAYHRVPALDATIRDVQRATDTTTDDYDLVELYSCFPAMPKLTRRALGRDVARPISVTGGLSFFGGPGSNYLTHSIAAMVEQLRAHGGTGFIHGVGMFNTKHHALVLADHPRADGGYPPPADGVGDERMPVEAPVPVVEDYSGPGSVVTFSVLFDRDGSPEAGTVIGEGRRGERFAARVDPRGDTLHRLTDGTEPVGHVGTVVAGDIPEFRW